MTLEEKQTSLVEEINLIPDPYERLGYIVERGCMSQLWVVPEFKDGRCFFRSDSDSAIVKGIAELLCTFYSDARSGEILDNNAEFLGEVGITQHLSPNRRNGLSRIVESIQRFARSCLTES
jgi:cysteine desulfuration protein SufE